MKYIKPKGADKYEGWLIDLVAKNYEVSKIEAEDYLKILYASHTGKQKIIELAENYGTDPKVIKKLKINV
jgi:hypothetical protein